MDNGGLCATTSGTSERPSSSAGCWDIRKYPGRKDRMCAVVGWGGPVLAHQFGWTTHIAQGMKTVYLTVVPTHLE